jgi:exosortase/archaeosortase family protein
MRKLGLYAGAAVFLAWALTHTAIVMGDREGFSRIILGVLFALLIFMRPLLARQQPVYSSSCVPLAAGLTGTLMVVGGMALRIHQFEWLGIMLVIFACLRWALPDHFARDAALGVFVLYWVHPLPGQIFDRIQMMMQYFSVHGAERLLQAVNVRVWADGVLLITGMRVFGVPDECSGMRTAVTVLLCLLGSGILLRIRWWEMLVFLAAGLLQVMIVNVVRIAFMVYWSPRMPKAWSDTFLHDTLGWFLLLCIVLCIAEVSWWRKYVDRRRKLKKAIEEDELEPPEQATVLPVFWRVMARVFLPVTVIMLMIGISAGLIYRQRPYHRAMMIRDVVESLMAADQLEKAEAAVNDAIGLQPDMRDLRDTKGHILILRKKYPEVLDEMGKLPPPLNTFEVVMKSWALMSLKRSTEAMDLAGTLSQEEQSMPGVSIVKAEYAAILDKPGEVASNVLLAAKTSFTLDRVRDLFPYLAVHEMWDIIARVDMINVPHNDLINALISVQARINKADLAGAGRVLRLAMTKWPNDVRLRDSLYFMALHAGRGEWEEMFAASVKADLTVFQPDDLAALINQSFKINRPDLGWALYSELQRKDPRDPQLWLAPARYGADWFAFRKRFLGLTGESESALIDLRLFYLTTRDLVFLRGFWDLVPLGSELAAGRAEDMRTGYLAKATTEIARRMADGSATYRMERSYPLAMAMTGGFDEAHAALRRLEAKYPDRKREFLMDHADYYHAENRWEESYEMLLERIRISNNPDLSSLLMMIDNLLKMDLGVMALEYIKTGQRMFPDLDMLRLAESGIWNVFGQKEYALFLMGSGIPDKGEKEYAQLLRETGRYRKAMALERVLGMPRMKLPEREVFPPPAEHSVEWSKEATLDKAAMAKMADAYAAHMSKISSPFLKAVQQRVIDYCRAEGQKEGADAEKWESAGRDAAERACALHRLAVLQLQSGRLADARKTLSRAVGILPSSQPIWRLLVLVSGGDIETISRAIASCPDDPEIWLAYLVKRFRRQGAGPWLSEEIKQAISSGKYSTETLLRAGDFLFRNRQYSDAAVLAHHLLEKENSLLSVEVLGLQCALALKDLSWSIKCALRGAEIAINPVPFHRLIVALKSAGRSIDAEMAASLEYLANQVPDEIRWTEDLGTLYFVQGDTRRAFNVLGPLVESAKRGITARALVVAAESARLEGETAESIRILDYAHTLFPERLSILNNLLYALADNPSDAKRALALLPELLEQDDKSYSVLDTVAMVYLRNGRIDQAQFYMDQALRALDASGYAAPDVLVNAAEISQRLGQPEEALKKLEAVLKDSRRSSQTDSRARRMMDRIKAEMPRGSDVAPGKTR